MRFSSSWWALLLGLVWQRSRSPCYVSAAWLRNQQRIETTASLWRFGSEPRWKSPGEIKRERIAAMRASYLSRRA